MLIIGLGIIGLFFQLMFIYTEKKEEMKTTKVIFVRHGETEWNTETH